MRSIKGALFDLDGTLADSLESIAVACNKVLVELGFPVLPKENYKYYAGDGVRVLWKRVLEQVGDKEGKNFDEAYAKYTEIFKMDCTYQVTAFKGMREVLGNMKSMGIRLAVVSNKPHDRAVEVVERLFGKGFFDEVLGLKEGYPKKPDPLGALSVANSIGVSPKECIFVGDTNVDMQTGKGAGMLTIGVLWGFRTKEELVNHHADHIVEFPEELLDLIK
ncbi:HAD family hydrolase [Anaeromicropila populeti]|uniref:Phosphoglycolate phosphatase n=1 Tax=Anaeromicropila populeti TaxID=37658 RepID=A0A1I6HLG0_9FIRM|nr:HAD family hydrolase [Anaeromicropila populeti]SFR55120.1 phosphoglycolate phosphatase [Anaeromicropila populeti]